MEHKEFLINVLRESLASMERIAEESNNDEYKKVAEKMRLYFENEDIKAYLDELRKLC